MIRRVAYSTAVSRDRVPVLVALISMALLRGHALATPQWSPGVSATPGLWERYLPAMAFDSDRSRIVLFGGGTGSISYRDTWEFDGVAWTPGPVAPLALTWRYGHAMVYDGARRTVVMFGGYEDITNVLHNDTWEYDGITWTVGPAAPLALTERWAHGMAYDEGRGRTVLFGGEDWSGMLNDTWEYDGLSWGAGPAAPPGLVPRNLQGMAYHAGIDKVVVFGGGLMSPPLNDTWFYDGVGWTPGPVAPPGLQPRYGPGMAYDSARGVMVLFGGAWGGGMNDTWELDGVTWTQGPAAPPGLTPRYFVGMAFDSARDVSVLFGGSSGPEQNDTWEYDGTSWSQGPVAPLGVRPRSYHGMAYDETCNATVVFGGLSGLPQNDSWDFDGATWTAGPPPPLGLVPRWLHAVAFDRARSVTIMFGGADDTGVSLDDTWEHDGVSWQLGVPAPAALGARTAHAMAYDPRRGLAVLFGGQDDMGASRSDTWEYDGSAWSPGPPAPPGLVPRYGHAMAFHTGRDVVALFGGWDDAAARDDTWFYDGSSWQPGPSAPPGLGGRFAHAVAGDAARGRVVLFGGITSPMALDTWELDATGWVPGPATPAALGRRVGHAMSYDSARARTVLFGASLDGDTWEYFCPAIAITPTTLPAAAVGAAYLQVLTAAGGSAPYTFAVTAGTLPTGISLSPAGALSGTPTMSGTFSFTVTVTDAFVCTGSQAYVLTVSCPGISLAPASLPSGAEGTPYRVTITATGGAPPYTFAVSSGALPTGLGLAPDGTISGTPTTAGSYRFTITATDTLGCSGTAGYFVEVGRRADFLVGAGHGAPNPNRVRAFTAAGVATAVDFLAYAAGSWGTNVAGGDVDGGLDDEILTGPGPGLVLGPHVRAFGRSGAPIAKVSFYAYGTLRYGVNVAAGNIDADAFGEILSGPGPSEVFAPHVRGWSFDATFLEAIPKVSFFAFATLRYGANIASSDVDADGFDEILAGPGPGPTLSPQVRGFDFDGLRLAAVPGCAFDAFSTPGYGVWIAGADVTGGGSGAILATPGPGGTGAFPARFLGFELAGGASAPLAGFDATPLSSRYGGRVGAGDVSLDGVADLIAAAGPDPSATSLVVAERYTGSGLVRLPGEFVAFSTFTYGASASAARLGL